MSRLITKIKVSDNPAKENPVVLHYEHPIGNGEVEQVTLPTSGKPHPDFEDALGGLIDIVVTVCRLEEAEWHDAKVIGVTLKHSDDGVGLTITAMRKFDYDPIATVVINTPYLAPEFFNSGDRVAIERILKEADRYIDGKRAQGSLLDQPSEQLEVLA